MADEAEPSLEEYILQHRDIPLKDIAKKFNKKLGTVKEVSRRLTREARESQKLAQPRRNFGIEHMIPHGEYSRIREYLLKHPELTLPEVATELGASKSDVNKISAQLTRARRRMPDRPSNGSHLRRDFGRPRKPRKK